MTTHYTLERAGWRPIMPVLLSVQNILAHTTSAKIPYITLTGHNDLYQTHSITCNHFDLFRLFYSPLTRHDGQMVKPLLTYKLFKIPTPLCKSSKALQYGMCTG
jgi:hypothetical protein